MFAEAAYCDVENGSCGGDGDDGTGCINTSHSPSLARHLYLSLSHLENVQDTKMLGRKWAVIVVHDFCACALALCCSKSDVPKHYAFRLLLVV
jgi:hypothetical protein